MNTTASPSPSATGAPAPRLQTMDSCWRGAPLLALFGSALVWLVIATLLGLIDSLKFHDPNILGNTPYFTYGRVAAATETSLLYGFGAQAAFAMGIWLLCRLGKTVLAGPLVMLVGVMLWNTTVSVGIIAILCGAMTGLTSFQMPEYCDAMLFVAFVLIGICALLTFHQRRTESLYPSQWFVLGSFFWFPWIFSTAALALLCLPVRGVLQASTAWWYGHNFDTVFLGFAGLAAIFYFLPKMTNRPLYSYYVAMLSFWLLAFFGSWGGIPDGAPVPSWMTGLSVVGTVFTAVPVFAIAMNLYQTVHETIDSLDADPVTQFIYVALTFWIVASVQQIVGVVPHISAVTGLTWFGVAQKELFHFGFFAMAAFGAMYYIVPPLLNMERTEWCPKLMSAHFWLMLGGVFISYVSLLIGGVVQGALLADPNRSDVQIVRGVLMPLRAGTLGDLMIFAGTVVFLVNFAQMVLRRCYACQLEFRRAL